ncbi:hypothetical protein IWQ62_006559 [Dispira parvispora]|uniref:Neuroguidin n=1 Tax=Dispira parvispora TaxID=1520584 RepID=A0A9W8AHJ3_9FUNG|nr:hypothetical protein IWQ62_006559 [Dispira parvispora]
MSTSLTAETRLQELLNQLDSIHGQVKKLRSRVHNEDLDTSHGISLLEVKYQLLLEYLTQLFYIVYLKVGGCSIANHEVIQELIRNRVLLERVKPVEQKLKYQIDKVIRAATLDHPEQAYKDATRATASTTGADPLQFKPNIHNMTAVADDRDHSETRQGPKDGVYRAPKLAPVHYDEDPDLASRRTKYEERLRERAARSTLVKELMAEYDHRPEQAAVHGNSGMGGTESLRRKQEERAKYEEDNFVRLSLTRKEKQELKKARFTRLDDEFRNLNDFASMASLRNADKANGQGAAQLLDKVKSRRKRDAAEVARALSTSKKRFRK